MNKSDISKDKIIAFSLKLLRETGSADLNMREIASAMGAAVGSLYNYFPTKADLVIALIGHVWSRAFSLQALLETQINCYPAFVKAVYEKVYEAQADYHNFFITHRTLISGSQRAKGKSSMAQYMQHLHTLFLQRLLADTSVRDGLWTEAFQPQQLVDFTFSNMFSALSINEPTCGYFCQVLEKLLYA